MERASQKVHPGTTLHAEVFGNIKHWKCTTRIRPVLRRSCGIFLAKSSYQSPLKTIVSGSHRRLKISWLLTRYTEIQRLFCSIFGSRRLSFSFSSCYMTLFSFRVWGLTPRSAGKLCISDNSDAWEYHVHSIYSLSSLPSQPLSTRYLVQFIDITRSGRRLELYSLVLMIIMTMPSTPYLLITSRMPG